MRSTPHLILLALICLATTISPAVADTPTVVPPISGPRAVYQGVIDREPGAWLDLHMQLLFEMYLTGESTFIRHRGRYTQTAAEAVDAGDFPFRPVNSDGSDWPVIDIPIEQIVPPSTIGLRNRPADQMLLMMGANGDPLAPCIRSRELTSHQIGWPLEYPWRMRLARHLSVAVERQLQTAVALSGGMPESAMALQQTVQMAPSGCSWQSNVPPDGVAVLVETDGARQLLRITAYPHPGSVPPSVSQIDMSTHSLNYTPYLTLEPVQWQSWGILVWDAPIPSELAVWSPPEPPPYEPYGWAHRFDSSPSGQISREFALLGAWYQVNAGRLPTVEELIASDWGLHVPLDYDGTALNMQHYPLTEFTYAARQPAGSVDRSTLPTGLLIDVDASAVMTLKQDAQSPGIHSSPNFAWRQEVAIFGNRWQTGSATRLNGKAADAWNLWQRDPTQLAPGDQASLWKSMSDTDAGFGYRYLSIYHASLTNTLGVWLRHYPDRPALPEWSAILESLHLRPRHYTILAPDEGAPVGWATMSLEYAPLPGIMRCTVTHPSGLRLINYEAVANVEQTARNESWTLGVGSFPEITVLDYQHVVTIALPIPEPPVVTEVSTP